MERKEKKKKINYLIQINFIMFQKYKKAFIQYKNTGAMYTQDQFEPLTRNSCKTDIYQLNTNICQNILQIHLKTIPTYKQYFRYSTNLTLEDLDIGLQQKFDDLKILQAYITDTKNINVNIQTGIIQLMISVNLFNGKTIAAKVGQIKLRQHIFDAQKCLQRMLASCQAKDLFTQINYRNTMMQVASMFKVLFKKFQILEQTGSKQQFYQFSPTIGKKLVHSIQNTIKTKKSSNQRKLSSIYQLQFQNQKNKTVTKEDLKQLQNQINAKINCLDGNYKKIESQFESKIDQVKKEVKNFMQNTNKDIPSYKQFVNQIQSSQIYNFITQNKLSRTIKMQQSSNNVELQNTIAEIKTIIQKLTHNFQNFRDIVMSKIGYLGQANQAFSDKLKKLILQLDLRLQERNIEQWIYQLNNKIIDKSTPYFQQFEIRGTQIQYKGKDSQNTILLGKMKISSTYNTFSIKLVKTLVNNIQIGLVDSTYRLNRDCWSQPNFILYVGWNSTVYEGPCDIILKQGEAITEGDVVTVRANIETGLIEWFVGGTIRTKVIWPKLKDKTISWVPMVRFFDHGDVISWVNSVFQIRQ